MGASLALRFLPGSSLATIFIRGGGWVGGWVGGWTRRLGELFEGDPFSVGRRRLTSISSIFHFSYKLLFPPAQAKHRRRYFASGLGKGQTNHF